MLTTDASRDRFTDEEWDLHIAGRCCYLGEYGIPYYKHCGQPRDGESIYCGPHTAEVQEMYP